MTQSDPKSLELLYSRDRASQTEQLLITRQLVILNAAFAAVASSLELRQVLDTVTQELLKVLDVKACTLSEWSPEKNTFMVLSENGPEIWKGNKLGHGDYELNDYPLTAKTIRNLKLKQYKISSKLIGEAERHFMEENKFKSLLLIPLNFQDRVFGVIKVYDDVERTYENYEILIIKLFANQISIAIENANLFEQTKQEIDTRIVMEEKLQHDALHDALTGLPNRILFHDRLERAILRKKREKDQSFAVLYLDLDRFKMINDGLGHIAGDEVLVKISRVFSETIRDLDTVSRYGGDEFLFLLEGDLDEKQADKFAKRLYKNLGKPVIIQGKEVITTVSMGIVMSSQEYQNPEDYIRDADIAMYHAKSNGKGRYEFFTDKLRSSAFKRLTLETDLRRAIKEKEFMLHYQPIVSLANNRITGFEALLRWKDQENRQVYPMDFIPLAEETGLIVDLGFWVLFEALKQVSAWQKEYNQDPPLTVSVNISGKQLEHPDFVQQVIQILNFQGVDSNRLILEITETVLIEEKEIVADVLRKLVDYGIKISLDDFGTGYANLGYLSDFSINTLKIDRTFISNMSLGEDKKVLVDNIIKMGKDLGLEIIAEGVETIEQAIQLRNLGCHFGQGFIFQEAQNAIAIQKYIDAYFKVVN